MPELFSRTTILIVAAFSLFLAACTGTAPVTPLPSPVTQTDASLPTQMAAPTQTAALIAPPVNRIATSSVSSATAAPTATTAPVKPSATPQALATTAVAAVAFACTPGVLTPAETEGPYYTANPPLDGRG